MRSHLLDSPTYSSSGEPTEIAQNGRLFLSTWRPWWILTCSLLPSPCLSLISKYMQLFLLHWPAELISSFCPLSEWDNSLLWSPRLCGHISQSYWDFLVGYPELSIKLSRRQASQVWVLGPRLQLPDCNNVIPPLLCQCYLPSNEERATQWCPLGHPVSFFSCTLIFHHYSQYHQVLNSYRSWKASSCHTWQY